MNSSLFLESAQEIEYFFVLLTGLETRGNAMFSDSKSEPNDLLDRAAQGEVTAIEQLLAKYRSRLKRMVSTRLDQRVMRRVDPSDVVQDALTEAAKKLPVYLADQAIEFYPWLRQIAWEQVIAQHRRHLRAQARSVNREQAYEARWPDDSVMALANQLSTGGTSPSGRTMRKEQGTQLRELLNRLKPIDREVLALRYLEQLSTKETAEVLGLTERGVKTRQRRAIERLTVLLKDQSI